MPDAIPSVTPEPVPAENPPAAEAPAAEPKPADPADAPLGDAGKRALDAEREARRAAEARAKAAEAEAAEAKAKAEGREKEFEAEQARRKVEADALAKANERILQSEVRLAAKGVLADPGDALRYPEHLDISKFEVRENGEVDSAAIAAAVEALAAAKPYLAAARGPRNPAPDPGQGPRPASSSVDAEYAAHAAAMKLPSSRK